MAKRKPMRRKNSSGSVVRLSGNRRQPFEVRVNTHMDERNYPVYDVLGRFEDRDDAMQALLEYNKDPYDLNNNKMTFANVYDLWYEQKFTKSKKKYSASSIGCTRGAFNKSEELHNRLIKDIRTQDMQRILDNYELSHAYMEHIRNLFRSVCKYAMQYDFIKKDYSEFIGITKDDDDQPGVPFTNEEVQKLWNNKEKPFVDSVLILIYSGWRISELLTLELDNIDIQQKTFKGGIKTTAGKNRIVPIHSKIYGMVSTRYENNCGSFICDDKPIINPHIYYKYFNEALTIAGINSIHTPHDCRHTFATMLDNAGANTTSTKRLLGHSSGGDVTEKVYTHKDIEQLRKAIELI